MPRCIYCLSRAEDGSYCCRKCIAARETEGQEGYA